MPSHQPRPQWLLSILCLMMAFSGIAQASIGDWLPEFRDCVQHCTRTNCEGDNQLGIPLQHRLLLWTCPAECDYTCQHITTDTRLARDPPYLEPIVQYHGKWPFHRFLGMQEPASVLFSLLNLLAHNHGLSLIRAQIPSRYPLRKYYIMFGYFGLASWVFSIIFHTRDFKTTEKLDYFAAGASVMYGMYYTPIRIFRWDRPENLSGRSGTVLRLWTMTCVVAYLLHISYLAFIRFDYTYNMAANVVLGLAQNIMWTWFSVQRYRKVGRVWAAWPGLIVFWLLFAMSLELFDFPPWWGMVDAHALWHLGTVGPTIWWYNFLLKDAQEDIQGERLKQ
ncbi:related to PER1 protein, involved in manganese homeostasis [Ramularia collo-cygni]|uniref:Post-GPI attachment to proteins factor 3 n=1 Tax=Ramularia collo-cygni TaxID=112498 RepID=A0A2D3USN2_9PEZI|nr:related to PER1 protein, involved in manganese homeostasis [Ramularia collo-cygni]CZT15700.1 related to PER1 protein, involved in manganese homeostasis [Ramularia collo-cygni]